MFFSLFFVSRAGGTKGALRKPRQKKPMNLQNQGESRQIKVKNKSTWPVCFGKPKPGQRARLAP